MLKCKQDEIATKDSIRSSIKFTFDAPFPKRNRKLTHILGDTLHVYWKCGQTTYKVISTRKYNLIIDTEFGDTIFKGTVCKYRDLFYFSEKIDDTSYRIFALNITDSLIYGLQHYYQYAQIDSLIDRGKYPKLVKFINQDKTTIRLQPDKKELRKLYSSILSKTTPFEIIKTTTDDEASTQQDDIVAPIEPDDFDMIANVYPNPVVDMLTVELQQQVSATYHLSDLNGKILLKGQLNTIKNKIDMGDLAGSIYLLTIIGSDQQIETVKIIKSK